MKNSIMSIVISLAVVSSPTGASIVLAPQVEAQEIIVEKIDLVPSATDLWIEALEKCESSGNPKAVNPKDRDGTPSYGAFQFKPSTYRGYAKILNLSSTTDFMNRKGQLAIVRYMVTDPKTKIENQFPGCVRKLGKPPATE